MEKKKFEGKKYHLKNMATIMVCIALITTVVIPAIGASSYRRGETQRLEPDAQNDNQPVEITVENKGDTIQLTYHISDFSTEPVHIENNNYVKILLPGESNLEQKGKPDLPHICRSILIPDTAHIAITITNQQYTEYQEISVAPSKGTLSRLIDPATIPYEFDSIYTQNSLFPASLAELGAPYIIRDFRGQVVTINPFQYNPLRHTLRFYTDITVEISPDGLDTRNIIERPSLPASVDIDFLPIYEQEFINFNKMDRYNPVGEQGRMLVITYGSFWSSMLPFVQWKNMKGVPTTMVNVSQIGTTAPVIKTYIVNYYNTYGLTFVLLVGDAAQIPTFIAVGGASDPTYSYIVGNDHYPDLFVGRFSASTPAQVQTQVLRSVEYEKLPQSGATWYKKGVGIASAQGPGDDNEYDYQHIRNIRTDLLNYGYMSVDELYDGSQGGQDAAGNPTTAMVAASINNGRSIINYCGHGSATSWGTSGFSNSNVNALTNDNMLPFIWSVACNNGEFNNYDACFAEAWLRATHNGEPTGAIATFMSSISQYWDEPMDAQDECNDLLVESYANNKKNTFGGISFNGCMHMNDQYGSSGYDMTDTWHVFGDPSLQVRTKTPVTMTVTHEPVIYVGATTFDVYVSGVSGALCALSRNYQLLGYGYTGATGHVTILLSQPLNGTTNVDLVVTAYNKMPYIVSLPVGSATPPATPVGPAKGIGGKGIQYTYSTNSTAGNDLYYKFFWGDGTNSSWVGPYASGQAASASHGFPVGIFSITAIVKIGTSGTPSNPSSALPVRMYLLGDINGNNIVGFDDINPFILALLDGETAYYMSYPDGYYYTADINLDGVVNFGDINPFVALLCGS